MFTNFTFTPSTAVCFFQPKTSSRKLKNLFLKPSLAGHSDAVVRAVLLKRLCYTAMSARRILLYTKCTAATQPGVVFIFSSVRKNLNRRTFNVQVNVP